MLITNAHCVEWHAQVKAQRRGSDVKHLAKVLSVGHECDAAVLTVENEELPGARHLQKIYIYILAYISPITLVHLHV